MKILKTISKNIAQNIRPELDSLFFDEEYIVGTDGYYLVRIKNNTELRGLYMTSNFKQDLVSIGDKFITKDGVIFEPIKCDKEFPDYKQVIPTENKDLFTFDIDKMRSILEIAKVHGLKQISFYNNERNLYASPENNNNLEIILMKIK